MKIIDCITLPENPRALRWFNGESIADIAKADRVKEATVIGYVRFGIRAVYESLSAGSRFRDIRISVKELDDILKSYPHFHKYKSIYTSQNVGFFKKHGEQIKHLLRIQLHETGRVFYHSKMVYTDCWEGNRDDLINAFFSKLPANNELITMHTEVKYISSKFKPTVVYAILKTKELSISE